MHWITKSGTAGIIKFCVLLILMTSSFFQFILAILCYFWHAIFHGLYHTGNSRNACLNLMSTKNEILCLWYCCGQKLSEWLTLNYTSCMSLKCLQEIQHEKSYVVADCEIVNSCNIQKKKIHDIAFWEKNYNY